MGRRVPLAGMEVSIMGSDGVEFVDVSVSPPSLRDGTVTPVASLASISLTEDCASCVVVGDPPTYLIWRVRKIRPHALELLEFSTTNEFRRIGLRIAFPEGLHPAVFVCKNEITPSPMHPFLLYAVTSSGVAYCLKLRNISTYTSCSVIPLDEIVEFNLQMHPNYKPVTSVSAIAGCLVVGRNDGSVSCFKLGTLDQHTAGFEHELQDESGINRLLGFISRVKLAGAVQDMVISEVYGRQLLFVLHSDGILRVWDLSCHSRVFSHSMNIATFAGAKFVRLWVGQANLGLNTIPLAILYRHSDLGLEMIYIYRLRFGGGDRVSLLLEPSTHNIPLDQGGCVDVKLASDKIWVLKDDELIFHNLSSLDGHVGEAQCYGLQEEFLADQLFQSTEYSSDAILWVTNSIFSSTKDEVVPFISSIFLRRLLHPGVYNEIALRNTFLEYNRHWTDSDFRSITSDGLKQEILSLIEDEGATSTSVSIYLWWKNFCTQYFHHWCRDNTPCGLLVDSSSGAVGLVRKNSLSLFRCLDNVEQLLDGFLGELDEFGGPGINLIDNDLDSEILLEFLRCVISISHRLGKTALAIFCESLMSTPVIPFGEIVTRILKILENGYSSSVAMAKRSNHEAACVKERERSEQKNLRKFSIEIILSLHALCKKGVTWGRVLNVIESFLKFFVPRKMSHKLQAQTSSDVNSSILIQSTSQIAKVMLESALDILLFLNYTVSVSGQIYMLHDDTLRIKLELVPMIEEIISEWHIIHFLAITPSESAAIEDFSSQLSLLQIDSNADKEIWKGKLGKCDFTLASLLLSNIIPSSEGPVYLSSKCLLNSHDIVIATQNFTSWLIWGNNGEPSASLNTATELALVLLRHGQYDAVEYLLSVVKAQSQNEKMSSQSMQDSDGGWCILHHLLGCCQLAQAHYKLHGVLKERKVHEATCSFFRASSGNKSSQALQSLPPEMGLSSIEFTSCLSSITWRFYYYQWAMQLFEQYNISNGAFEFALAALELVEEALSSKDNYCSRVPFNESAISIQGRLWANVFKFSLDLHQFYDAYCAVISNPDEESKYICLRRFIIVLYECNAIKILCCGELPFIGLTEKVEQELVWKAERSDLLSKPNLYKLLYAFEMHRHNWQKAANYIYLYSARLGMEGTLGDNQFNSLMLLERLNGLSSAINALHLVHPDYAWIEPLVERNSVQSKNYPSKKVKRTVDEQFASNDSKPPKWHSCIDIKQIENEFVLTSSEYLLSVANVKWQFTGIHEAPSELVDLLVQNNFYDMAFVVLLRFWRDSELKRELERVFSVMSLKCCPNRLDSSRVWNDPRTSGLLLISPNGEGGGSPDVLPVSQHCKGNGRWETLELYLEKYIGFNARLPFIVAETLLRTDPQMELPLWLVLMFKGGRREKAWGMTGIESNPASLFRLYVDYGRYAEATHLLVECMESFASMPPADLVNRKRPFSVYFPYNAIECLWCKIEELIELGHMVDVCEKLKNLLRGALLNHLKLLKVEADDVLSVIA